MDRSIRDRGSAGNCAGRLGNDDWDSDLNGGDDNKRANRDGNWSGDFFFKLIQKLPGAWEATRAQ